MRKIGDVFAGDKNRLAMAACKCFDLIMKNFWKFLEITKMKILCRAQREWVKGATASINIQEE